MADLRTMVRGRKEKKAVENQTIRDLATIMEENTGPFTRSMLAEKLSGMRPGHSRQELMNEVSSGIQLDVRANKRFVRVKYGWWDLADKPAGK